MGPAVRFGKAQLIGFYSNLKELREEYTTGRKSFCDNREGLREYASPDPVCLELGEVKLTPRELLTVFCRQESIVHTPQVADVVDFLKPFAEKSGKPMHEVAAVVHKLFEDFKQQGLLQVYLSTVHPETNDPQNPFYMSTREGTIQANRAEMAKSEGPLNLHEQAYLHPEDLAIQSAAGRDGNRVAQQQADYLYDKRHPKPEITTPPESPEEKTAHTSLVKRLIHWFSHGAKKEP